MSIRLISTEQLRRMEDQEGLVLQGCGGDPQEWLDGINEILAQECILKKGAGFEEAYTFRHDGLTCMLFPFKENMELDVGKLLYGGWHPIPPSAEHGCLTMYLTDWAVLFRNRKPLPSASSQTARS